MSTSIRISTLKRGTPKPSVGDRKEIKGVEHVYCIVKVRHMGRWMLDCPGGRQRCKWVSHDDPDRDRNMYYPGMSQCTPTQ